MGTKVARCREALGTDAPAEETARQHAIGGDADAQLAQGGQDLGLDAPAHEGVLDLEAGDGRHGAGPADRRGTRLGKPDMANIARLHEVPDGPHRVLDRHRRVDAGRHVEIDPIRAEPLQAVGTGRLDRDRPAVEAEKAAVRPALRPEFYL